MADNRHEHLEMMREKMRKIKHLKVDIGMEDELSGRYQNQFIEINRQLQMVGEIEFQLDNGRRLQEELDTYAKDVNKRVNKLYETMHHNDFKGQTEFYMEFVVEKIKAETDEVLASHAEIMERIQRDYENTPQAQVQKALEDEIRNLEQSLEQKQVNIQKVKDDMNGYDTKTKEWFKDMEDDIAELEAKIRAIEETEQNVPGEVEAQVEGTASSVHDPNEQDSQQIDTDDMDDELMLIGASQLFEQLPFAMENESVDSDLSGNSLKGEPSTSGTAAIRNDQSLQAMNENVRSASSTLPSVRDQNRSKNDKMAPKRSKQADVETSRSSDRDFDENRRAVRPQETTVRVPSLKPVQDSNNHGGPSKSSNANSMHQNRQTTERYSSRDYRSDHSDQTNLAGAKKSSVRFVEPSALAPHATKRKDASFDHGKSAKKSYYDSQHGKRDGSVDKSRRDMHDNQKAQAARRHGPMEPKQRRFAESSFENAGVYAQHRDDEHNVGSQQKSVGTLETQKSAFKLTEMFTRDRSASKFSPTHDGSMSSNSSDRNHAKSSTSNNSEQSQSKFSSNRSGEQALRGDFGSKRYQSDESQGYYDEPNVQQSPQSSLEMGERQAKTKSFLDDFSFLSDMEPNYVDSDDDNLPNVKKTSNLARGGENGGRNGSDESAFDDEDFGNNDNFRLDGESSSASGQNNGDQFMDFDS